MLFQPFINYNLARGWSINTAPPITADREAEPGERWTIPIGATVSKVFLLGSQMMSSQAGA